MRKTTAFGRTAVALLVLLAPQFAWAQELCSDRAAPENLRFEGVQFFKPDAIRRALSSDLNYLVLSHPREPLKPLLDYSAQAISSGYLHAGFADCRVIATPDTASPQIVIHVEEGRQYIARSVLVEGTELVTAAALQEKLAEPPPKEPPKKMNQAEDSWPADVAWVKRLPAPTDPRNLKVFTQRVLEMFEQEGRWGAQYTLAPRRTADGEMDLLLEVQDEGREKLWSRSTSKARSRSPQRRFWAVPG